MSFCEQLRKRREELGMTRLELADRLGVSLSAVGNYETGISAPKEEVLLRLFDALEVDPNYLYRGSFRCGSETPSGEELHLLEKYRRLPVTGAPDRPHAGGRTGRHGGGGAALPPPAGAPHHPAVPVPGGGRLCRPVFGEDYTLIPVEGEVPPGAELAVRIQGDSMAPRIADGSVVYVNHDPLQNGDVGIFCVDGDMLCKQYCRDGFGMVYLFSLNRPGPIWTWFFTGAAAAVSLASAAS